MPALASIDRDAGIAQRGQNGGQRLDGAGLPARPVHMNPNRRRPAPASKADEFRKERNEDKEQERPIPHFPDPLRQPRSQQQSAISERRPVFAPAGGTVHSRSAPNQNDFGADLVVNTSCEHIADLPVPRFGATFEQEVAHAVDAAAAERVAASQYRRAALDLFQSKIDWSEHISFIASAPMASTLRGRMAFPSCSCSS